MSSPRSRRPRRVFGSLGKSGEVGGYFIGGDATPATPHPASDGDERGYFDESFWEEQRPPHWG
ncbi:MAG TPA: hypothetical protein H9867_02340 [Candidatus Corynebacterium gallistercoris]|uniref:Uncharacterized protein n=1 Tax=Candidatus Corynebacterium gallistercoris TaxID=2838530 RepID=A0A9D1RZ53_9CORY|nr:hypothetical protein [Candidatus Corynebacterium gallistercoris]